MAGPWCSRSARSCVWIISFAFVYILCTSQCSSTKTASSNYDGRDQFQSVEITRPTVRWLSGETHWATSARRRRDVADDMASRELSETAANDTAKDLVVNYFAFGENYTLQLHLNENLLPAGYFEKYHLNGNYIVEKPLENQLSDHCYYQGHLLDKPDSWAAVSVCKGVSGMIFDGEEIHYIEPKTSSVDHLVFKDPLEIPFKCGFNSSESHSKAEFLSKFSKERVKRSKDFIREPYKSNSQSRYVELVIVNDHQEFKERNSSKAEVFERSKQIANIVNGLYAPLNIYIALVGVVVWSEYDEIKLSHDGDATLTNFLHYRRQKLSKEHPNDNAQLITAMKFDGGVVGKALKGPICTWEFSGGVNMDHSKVVGLVATTVAHEIGHNFGMEHDSDECKCPDDKCIMSPSSGATSPRHWSSCSKTYLKQAFQQSMDYCLRNKPTKIIGAVCGNGFLEAGEECDCGYKEFCDNKCCNASSCRLYPNARCATGMCCDTNTCQVKPASVPCRKDYSECDLPEYCDGDSEFCPNDVYVDNGAECNNGKAYCFEGQCKTHDDQCKLLWGNSGKMSEPKCFEQNQQGNDNGNCGYFKPNKTHKACHKEDILCGRLHCIHLNEKLEFGMESAATLAHSFIQHRGKTVICRSATVDLGIDNLDPGLAPNGAKCGDNKVCLHQKCQPLEKLKGPLCYMNCHDNGVCNNKGNCHCALGFGPPYCDAAGPGGSVDSGPVSDPLAGYQFLVAMYIIFLCIIPLTAIAGFGIYHFRNHLKTWWMSKARKAAINRSRAKQASMRKPRPPSCVGTDLRNVEISRPLPADPDCSIHGSALSRSNSGKGTWGRSSLRNVEISPPIPQSTTNSTVGKLVPVRPAPPKPLAGPQRTPSWTPGSMGSTNPFATVTRSASVRTNGENGRPLSGVARPQCPPPPRPPPPKVPPPPLPLNNTLDVLKNENNSKERSITPNSLIYSDPSEPLDFSNTPLAFVHSKSNVPNFESNIQNNMNLTNATPTYGNVGWNDFANGFEELQKKPYLNNSVNIDKNLASKVLKKPVYANGDQVMNIAPAPPPSSAKPNLVLSKPRGISSSNGTAMSTFSSNPVAKKNSFEQPKAHVSATGLSSHASVVASLAQKFENKTGDKGDNVNNRGFTTRQSQNRNNNSGHS